MGRASAYDMQRPVHEPHKKGHVAQSSENEPWAGRVEKSGRETATLPFLLNTMTYNAGKHGLLEMALNFYVSWYIHVPVPKHN